MGSGCTSFFTIMNPQNISILDYTYELPNERIAMHPLKQRDASKLLLYKNGAIEETVFSSISAHIPNDALLVTNNSKVINARIIFQKSSGAKIEIFCLEPLGNIKEYQTVMATTGVSQWKCLVGGAAKWKEEFLEKTIEVNAAPVQLNAKLIGRKEDAYHVEFSWQPAYYSFAEVISAAGCVPLLGSGLCSITTIHQTQCGGGRRQPLPNSFCQSRRFGSRSHSRLALYRKYF